jgi:hypothetical protein
MRQVICLKGRFPLLRNVWMELGHELAVYRITNSALIKYLWVVK